jgi:hypothetical protein
VQSRQFAIDRAKSPISIAFYAAPATLSARRFHSWTRTIFLSHRTTLLPHLSRNFAPYFGTPPDAYGTTNGWGSASFAPKAKAIVSNGSTSTQHVSSNYRVWNRFRLRGRGAPDAKQTSARTTTHTILFLNHWQCDHSKYDILLTYSIASSLKDQPATCLHLSLASPIENIVRTEGKRQAVLTRLPASLWIRGRSTPVALTFDFHSVVTRTHCQSAPPERRRQPAVLVHITGHM